MNAAVHVVLGLIGIQASVGLMVVAHEAPSWIRKRRARQIEEAFDAGGSRSRGRGCVKHDATAQWSNADPRRLAGWHLEASLGTTVCDTAATTPFP
jgi:hypothetical protein